MPCAFALLPEMLLHPSAMRISRPALRWTILSTKEQFAVELFNCVCNGTQTAASAVLFILHPSPSQSVQKFPTKFK